MGWITMSIRRAELQRSINDHTYEKLELSRQLRELSSFSNAIGDGTITPAEIGSLGTCLYGEALDFMGYSNEAASAVAQEQTDYYASAYDSLTQEQYYNNPSISAQAQLYYDENGNLNTNAMYANFYDKALKEYVEECVMPVLNERQKEIENQQAELETLVTSEEAELQQLKESIKEKIELILETVKYKDYLQSLGEEPDIIERKIENIDELISDAVRFEEQNGSSLSDFLASAALISSNDDEDVEGSVKLMTIHASKGLEFKVVFLTGLEEGLFPLGNEEGEANIEEERRLCYVGVTRAMETLYITRARSRLRGGRHTQAAESRFLGELKYGKSFKFNKGSTKNTFTNKSGNYADYIKNTSNSEKKEYNDDSKASFPASSKVYHTVFGEGIVLYSEGSGEHEKVTVNFKREGLKTIIANFLEKA